MLTGRLKHIAGKPYGHIGIDTLVDETGTPARVATTADVFLHKDDCSQPLRDGMEVHINRIEPDAVRGEGYLRATFAYETQRSQLDLLAKGGIELVPQSDDGTGLLVHSSVLTSFCLGAQLAAQMKELVVEGKTVRLLLVHWPAGSVEFPKSKERRQLVDMKVSLTSVNFTAPGKHRILAMLVWDQSESFLKDRFLSRSDDRYNTDIMSNDGSRIILEQRRGDHWTAAIQWFGTGCIEVDVPENLFAKRPFDWEFVNWMYSKTPKDQCAYRRRRFVAYPCGLVVGIVFFLLVGLHWLGRLIVAVALFLFGFRGVNFRTLKKFDLEWHLYQSIWEDLGRSIFVPRVYRNDRPIRIPFFLAVSPAVLIVILTIGIWVMLVKHMTWLDLAYLCLYLFGTGLLCMILVSVMTVINDSIDKAARESARKEAERRKLAREADLLICTATGPAKPSVWQMPFGPRMVRFYAFALKQRVCSSFAS
ncbi:hypothetical protein A2764_02980 [Candidatus Kaiserbacteria bacterium RIFCSPHIGHO2_01_FULL_55_79]|nr:MAG: hypothetical protein A2764_02980 [Candidatus Kaiserbacteria bacterium RIFCSPHIGHO2_01_FULL_55_79]